ncbi:MAG: DUF1501 domain-containing protein [Steroidobacteraceae bacterium]
MFSTRRDLLKGGLLIGGATLLGLRCAFGAQAESARRFVFVILRGALDGLAAVPPLGDPDYARLRRELAIPASGAGAALPLDHTFALNPGLPQLHAMYQSRELLVLHAVASPYRERSHFDGQDVLESGLTQPHASQSGWLNRALPNLPARIAGVREAGVALGQNVPLVMRGPAAVAAWSPAVLPDVDADTLQRLADLYAGDPLLSQRFADAQATQAMAQADESDAMSAKAGGTNQGSAEQGGANRRRGANGYGETVRMAANFLARDDGPAIAVFDSSGWDTHANEGAGSGLLTQRLLALDSALATLRDALGDKWRDTAVLVATEFGRTAATNGTRGTDHGTGAAAFLLGGAVNGGRVLCDWPGLSAANLYQGRDLKPTLDLRAVMKSVLHDHLQVAQTALDREVFPDSGALRHVDGLLRG